MIKNSKSKTLGSFPSIYIRFVGPPGNGKTMALNLVKNYLEKEGYTVFGSKTNEHEIILDTTKIINPS